MDMKMRERKERWRNVVVRRLQLERAKERGDRETV